MKSWGHVAYCSTAAVSGTADLTDTRIIEFKMTCSHYPRPRQHSKFDQEATGINISTLSEWLRGQHFYCLPKDATVLSIYPLKERDNSSFYSALANRSGVIMRVCRDWWYIFQQFPYSFYKRGMNWNSLGKGSGGDLETWLGGYMHWILFAKDLCSVLSIPMADHKCL